MGAVHCFWSGEVDIPEDLVVGEDAVEVISHGPDAGVSESGSFGVVDAAVVAGRRRVVKVRACG